MDPEQKQVADLYRRFVEAGASDEQAVRLTRRAVAELRAPGGPSIGPAGPTAQPAFPSLPPMVGGALDMLIAFGNGVTWGAAGNLMPAVGEMASEVRGRNPKTALAMGAAGAAMSLPVTMAAGTLAAGGGALAARILASRAGLVAAGGGGTLGALKLRQMMGGGN